MRRRHGASDDALKIILPPAGVIPARDPMKKSCRRAVLPLVPSPLAGEGARVCPRSRMGEGLARRTPHPFIDWQRRVALSRKGRGRNNEHRACDAGFFAGPLAGEGWGKGMSPRARRRRSTCPLPPPAYLPLMLRSGAAKAR